MNKICIIVDVRQYNIHVIIDENIADNILAFRSNGIDVQFLCLQSQYLHLRTILNKTNTSNALVCVVSDEELDSNDKLIEILVKYKKPQHTYAFYCDLNTLADDAIISLLDDTLLQKLQAYTQTKLINFNSNGRFFGGGKEALVSGITTKPYAPRDPSKNNVANLLKKIRTGK